MAGLIIEIPNTVEPISLAIAKQWCRVTTTDDDGLFAMLIPAAREACEVFTGRSIAPKGYMMTLDAFPYFTDSIASQQAYPPAYYSLPRYSTTLWNYSQMIKLWKPPCIAVQRISYINASDGSWHDLVQSPPLWYPGTVVTVGYKVMDNEANVQQCSVGGKTAANPPTWNYTQGGTTVEPGDPEGEGAGPVQWVNQGPIGPDFGSDEFGNFVLDKTNPLARLFPGPASAVWPSAMYVPSAVNIHYTAGYSCGTNTPGESIDGTNPPDAWQLPMPNALKIAILMLIANWYENREAAMIGGFKDIPSHIKMLLWTWRVTDFAPTRG